MSPELIVLGNLAVDDIVYSDGTTRMGQAGGAALFVALGATLWSTTVGIVSRVGSDYPDPVLRSLEKRGITLAGVERLDSPGLRTWLLYEGGLRRVVHRLDSLSHLEASPRARDIPAEWRPRGIHIAPLPIGLQSELIAEIGPKPEIQMSLDPYELLTKGSLAKWQELVSAVDYFLFSEDEVADSAWRAEPMPTLTRLISGRLKALFYKQGSQGGCGLDSESGKGFEWRAYEAGVVDTTGAGDAFAGGTLSGLLDGESPHIALQRGIVSASFAIEAVGAEALLTTTRVAANQRLQEWFRNR